MQSKKYFICDSFFFLIRGALVKDLVFANNNSAVVVKHFSIPLRSGLQQYVSSSFTLRLLTMCMGVLVLQLHGYTKASLWSLLSHKYERHGLCVIAKDRIPQGCGVRAPMDGFTACLWR